MKCSWGAGLCFFNFVLFFILAFLKCWVIFNSTLIFAFENPHCGSRFRSHELGRGRATLLDGAALENAAVHREGLSATWGFAVSLTPVLSPAGTHSPTQLSTGGGGARGRLDD